MKVLAANVVVLTLFAFASLSAAQESSQPSGANIRESVLINPKLPPFIFEIESKAPDEVIIRITGGPKSYRGQTFTEEVDDEKRPGFLTEDVNFDGYEDFAVIGNRGATGNVSYFYWVFDPKTGVFKDAPEEFDNITFVDTEQKLLISSSKGGNIEMSTVYYRVQDGRPVLIRSVEVRWARQVRNVVPRSYSDDTPVKITRIYENGKLRRTFYTTPFLIEWVC